MKNDWRNQHGKPRENSDLWKQLLSAQAKTGMTVHFEWALGKKSSVLKRVDKAAKAANRAGPEIDRGYKPGAIARSMIQRSGNPIPGKRTIGGDSTVQKKYIEEI